MVCMHLVYGGKDDRWHLKVDSRSIASFDTQGAAERDGKRRCNGVFQQGTPAQLIVYRKDGTVENEFNYGFDSLLKAC